MELVQAPDILTLDSVQAVPPDLGPGEPVYPAINSMCRVTSGQLVGNVYQGFASQLYFQSNGQPALRDRESVYVFEPNGIKLQPAIYDCRLVGNYLGLPLYVTNCCPTGGSSSSAKG
jgi:hypothetical protein